MASTMPSRHVRQKPNTLDRPPQVIERTTKEGRRLRYELKVIQQPERARACGSGAKSSADRRPVDPPPVVELKVFEVIGPNPHENDNDKSDITFAYDANFFLFTTLELARPIAHGRVAAPAASQVPVLTGMPVSGMAYLDRPCEAGYFIFPDLSVRHEGKYRLSFNLYEETKRPEKDADKEPALDAKPPVIGSQFDPEASFDWRMELKSDVFDVFSAKKFPGLAESTHLSRMVAEQGCRVRIRRDVRMRRRGDGKGAGDFDEDEVYERQSRAPTVVDELQRERSRSSSTGSEHDPRLPFDQQQGNLNFGQYQQPQFAAPPQPPMPPQHYPAPVYRQQPQYGQPAPPQAHHFGYDRQHPQSAYPSTQPRELQEDPYRRASLSGHSSEGFPRHYSAPEPSFNRTQPFHGYAPPQSPAPSSLPPLQLHLAGKYDNTPPAPLPPVRSIAPPLHSPTYDRKDDRFSSYNQHSGLVPTPFVPSLGPDTAQELARNGGKRSYETTFGSAATRESLFNGMRPRSPHDDGAYDDEDTAFMEDVMMKYKRADGSEYSRGLPSLG